MLRLGLIIFFVQTFSLIERSVGHGYLADPPARSSAWLFDPDFTSCCRYYNHAQMSCGGTYQQWAVNGNSDDFFEARCVMRSFMQEASARFAENPMI
jgi:hypothetical protein